MFAASAVTASAPAGSSQRSKKSLPSALSRDLLTPIPIDLSLSYSLQKATALLASGGRDGRSAAPQGTRVGNESSELALLLLLLGHDTPPWVITVPDNLALCLFNSAYSLPDGRAKIAAGSVAESVQTQMFCSYLCFVVQSIIVKDILS
jgi:hypothetical protein